MTQELRPHANVNPEMLVLARESRGLTQSEVARLLGVSQGYVSKTESGLLEPTDDALSKLAGLLDYPEPFFRLADPVYGPGVTEFWHRKRQAATAKQMWRVYAETAAAASSTSAAGLWSRWSFRRPSSGSTSNEFDGPSDVAGAVRNAWNLLQGPVRDLTRAVEDSGGIVVRCDFGTRLVDAVSRWVPGMPPLFFLNEGLYPRTGSPHAGESQPWPHRHAPCAESRRRRTRRSTSPAASS